jgi:DUF1680 family protein
MRRFKPVRFTEVRVEGDFWRERLETVLTKTIPSQYEQLEQHGILESLAIPTPPPPLRIPAGEHGLSMQVFWDSDVGKWIEAASYALAHRRDTTIEAQIEGITDLLQQAQLADGYLNCWYIGREVDRRWTNLRDRHELYCAGHLLEGALAYFQATGRRRLLDILQRYMDHIAGMFGRGPGQKRGYCGHQEIELALVKLFHATGIRKYLDLARYFIDERGSAPPHYFDVEAVARGEDPQHYWFKNYEYNQSHRPVRDQDKVVGHAVRAMYMYTAMADLAADLGDATLKRACEKLWEDVTSHRMYLTAGLGPAAANEGFTRDYDLPNDSAYAETCASVALIFWAQRMLNLDCDGAYADVLETALYNGALSGLSRDGSHYFYQNPLESDGSHQRWTWHPCPCCPMNVARLVASVGGYFYSVADDAIAIHLYCAGRALVPLGEGPVGIRQQTDYPWSGRVKITLEPPEPRQFTLQLRIPGWARSHRLTLNGVEIAPVTVVRGYAQIVRTWSAGDEIELELPMPAERVYAHPKVRADLGRVALKRGPLVYCLEQVDNPGAAIDLLRLPRTAPIDAQVRRDLFDGVVVLSADGEAAQTTSALYQAEPYPTAPVRLSAIPYYAWSNRGRNAMQVWIPETYSNLATTALGGASPPHARP